MMSFAMTQRDRPIAVDAYAAVIIGAVIVGGVTKVAPGRAVALGAALSIVSVIGLARRSRTAWGIGLVLSAMAAFGGLTNVIGQGHTLWGFVQVATGFIGSALLLSPRTLAWVRI